MQSGSECGILDKRTKLRREEVSGAKRLLCIISASHAPSSQAVGARLRDISINRAGPVDQVDSAG